MDALGTFLMENFWLLVMLLLMSINFYTRIGSILICLMFYLEMGTSKIIFGIVATAILFAVFFKFVKFPKKRNMKVIKIKNGYFGDGSFDPEDIN